MASIDRVLHSAADTFEGFVEVLRGLVSQPSISTRSEGIGECVTAIVKVMREAGVHTEVIETGGHPAVLGEVAGSPGETTVLFYGHYDVQPPEPLEAWSSPPFEATIRGDRIYGRGVADNKGQLLCHIWAVRLWRETIGRLPITVKFLIEGEEEIGSPHLPDLVRAQRERLAADIVCTADGAMLPEHPTIYFGVRGLLYIEVVLRGAATDAHSGRLGNVLPQPALELVRLLGGMVGEDGLVTLPGFYDRIRPPSSAELALLDRIPFDRDAFLQEHGLTDSPIQSAGEYHRRLTYTPTFNIAGLASGYVGPGMKTIIPSSAVAKIDVRLVASQDPDEVFALLTDAVSKRNPRAQVRRLAGVPPSRTDPSLPICQDVIHSVRTSWDLEPVLVPAIGGTGPDFVFTQILGAPSIIIPYANHDESNHAPNENMRLELIRAGIRTTAHIIDGLSRWRGGRPH